MNSKHLSLAAFIIALICIIVPWFTIQSQYLVNGNISWLLIAAERLLGGQSMAAHIYETNPPLSIIIYIPHILFSKALNLPTPVGGFYFTSILAILSSLAVNSIIKNFTFLSATERKTFILGYIISVTLITTLFFSDREHLIILALIPFILCQYAMTKRIAPPKFTLVTIIIIGAAIILIKPHYGLLPCVMLIHRMISHRRFNIFKDIDFIALSSMTLIYVGVIFTFFPDYINVIFPDVLTLYATNSQPATVIQSIQTHLIAAVGLTMFELFREDLDKEKRGLLLLLYSCALLCIIPYIVQMKGFYNHIIPVYAFLTCAVTLSISLRLSIFIKRFAALNIAITIGFIFFIVQVISPLNQDYPKQSDIPDLPLAKFLGENCAEPCSFFAFHGDIEIINPTAAYMGYTHATRFPTFWFLPKILSGVGDDALKQKYVQMVTDDLEYYKPSVILIAKDLPVANIEAFNFLDFFGDILSSNYKNDGVFEFDRANYFQGTTLDQTHILKYDVYKRL